MSAIECSYSHAGTQSIETLCMSSSVQSTHLLFNFSEPQCEPVISYSTRHVMIVDHHPPFPAKLTVTTMFYVSYRVFLSVSFQLMTRFSFVLTSESPWFIMPRKCNSMRIQAGHLALSFEDTNSERRDEPRVQFRYFARSPTMLFSMSEVRPLTLVSEHR